MFYLLLISMIITVSDMYAQQVCHDPFPGVGSNVTLWLQKDPGNSNNRIITTPFEFASQTMYGKTVWVSSHEVQLRDDAGNSIAAAVLDTYNGFRRITIIDCQGNSIATILEGRCFVIDGTGSHQVDYQIGTTVSDIVEYGRADSDTFITFYNKNDIQGQIAAMFTHCTDANNCYWSLNMHHYRTAGSIINDPRVLVLISSLRYFPVVPFYLPMQVVPVLAIGGLVAPLASLALLWHTLKKYRATRHAMLPSESV